MTTILIDDREKAPFRFPAHDSDAQVIHKVTTRLATGDYSLLGYEDLIAIERKKASELYHTVGAGRRRFRDELARMEDINRVKHGYAAVVVEGSLPQVIGLGEADQGGFTMRGAATAGAGRRVTAGQVVGTLSAWSVWFGVPIWFAGSLEIAQQLTWELLRQAQEKLQAQAKAKARARAEKQGKPKRK